MFYSFKQTLFKLNDQIIPVNSVDITTNTQINHLILSNQKAPMSYAASRGVFGQCRINYYITGQELLKSYFVNSSSPISGNFANLFFQSGYLTSYSFSAGPNEPLTATAEILFFEPLTGTISGSGAAISNIAPLNVSDMTISADSIGFGSVENITSITYSYVANLTPLFYNQGYVGSGTLNPARISVGEKEINCEVRFDNYDYNLLFTGNKSYITLNLNDSAGINRESFTVFGQIIDKNISTAGGQVVSSSFRIRQNNIFLEPSISGFSPVSGRTDDNITISGSGLDSTFAVLFGGAGTKNIHSRSVTINANNIVAQVPPFAIDGPIIILTAGGEVRSTGNFDVTNPIGQF